MAEPISRSSVQVSIWPGLFTNGGPLTAKELPGSAVEQVNLQVNAPGQMATRLGIRKAKFDEET